PDPRSQINDTISIMPLKDRDLQKLIDVINNNIHNATHGKDISKEHYQFLVYEETAGIGKTRLGQEVFNTLQHHWAPPTRWTSNGLVHIKYLRLDFGKYDFQFREFRHDALTAIRSYLCLNAGQCLFLFIHNDEFQKILMSPQYIFIQTFLSGTAPHSVIRAKEPTLYSWHFAECPLLSMAALVFQMDQLKISQTVPTFAVYPDEMKKQFTQYNYLSTSQHSDTVASDIDKQYAVTTFAEERRSLTWALIRYYIGSIPVMKTDIPSQEYPDETFEVLERDRHLVLKHRGDNKYVVQMPLIFLYLYNQVLHMATNILDDILTPMDVTMAGLGTFCSRIRSVLQQCLGKKVQSLREIYRGAYGHKDTLELRIKLHLSDVDWRSNNIIINGWAAPFADCFRHEVTEDENFLLIGSQQKWKANNICIEDILAEHKKI
ncbi:94_t:CDS:2, partial [Racocetra persica]